MSAQDNKPRLTEAQKKQNHIVSEQKRREAIRRGFDRLAEIVPGMEGQGRSEAVVLAATVTYLKAQVAKKKELKALAKENGMSERDFERAYSGAERAAREAEALESESEIEAENDSEFFYYPREHGGK